MLAEILLAVAAVLALGGLACLLWARLVCPVRGVQILIPAAGDGTELEQTVRGLRTLSDQGRLKSEAIYLADAGLDPAGRQAALRLCRRYPEVRLWPAKDITTG